MLAILGASIMSRKITSELRAHFGGSIPKASGKRVVSDHRRLLAYEANGKRAIVSEKVVESQGMTKFIPLAWSPIG